MTARPWIAVSTAASLASIAAPVSPQASPRDHMLVSPEWLADHIDDPQLVLLHVGDEDGFAAEHIPGAVHIAMADIAAPSSVGQHQPGMKHLELPDPAVARAKLEELGVSDGSGIVVYYGNDWVSPATRIIFTLDWLGLGDRTSLLDGGMQAWKAAGQPVTSELATPRRGSLSARPTRDAVVSLDFMKTEAKKPGIAIVDGRAAVFYDGVREGGNGARGHIEGAGSVPFTDVFDDRLRLRPAEELRELFRTAGVEPGERIVAYCHIGQQATAVVFAARSLGYDIRLFDGSMDEWAGAGLPMVVPPGR